MKKKLKGFTLIELLAIIVILALVLVITIPVITKVVKNANKSAVIESAYGYKDAINKFYATETLKNPNFKLEDGTYNVSDLKNMGVSVNGTEPTEGWVEINKNMVTDYSLKFGDYVTDYYASNNTTETVKAGNLRKDYLLLSTEIGSEVKNFGGYNWHVIATDNNSVTLILDPNQIDKKAHTSNLATYNWGQSLIRSYINGEFKNSLGKNINAALMTTGYVCTAPSGYKETQGSVGGYLQSEIPEGDYCKKGMVIDYVRLLTPKEYTALINNPKIIEPDLWIKKGGWSMYAAYYVGSYGGATSQSARTLGDYTYRADYLAVIQPIIKINKEYIRKI